jgi:hypothetical protein
MFIYTIQYQLQCKQKQTVLRRIKITPELRIIFGINYHQRIRGAGVSWRGGVRSPRWGAGDCCSHHRDGGSAWPYRAGQCGEIGDRNLRCRSSECWCGSGPAPRRHETGGTCRDIAGCHEPVSCSDGTSFETSSSAVGVDIHRCLHEMFFLPVHLYVIRPVRLLLSNSGFSPICQKACRFLKCRP